MDSNQSDVAGPEGTGDLHGIASPSYWHYNPNAVAVRSIMARLIQRSTPIVELPLIRRDFDHVQGGSAGDGKRRPAVDLDQTCVRQLVDIGL